MSYPGGKAGAGVFQQIINQIPPHRVYIEPFLGGGAVLLHKRLAVASIGIDCDTAACAWWKNGNIFMEINKQIYLLPKQLFDSHFWCFEIILCVIK